MAGLEHVAIDPDVSAEEALTIEAGFAGGLDAYEENHFHRDVYL